MAWNESGPLGSLRQGAQPPGAPLPDLPAENTFIPCPDMAQSSLRQGARGGGEALPFTLGRGAGRTYEAVFPSPQLYVATNSQALDAISRYGTGWNLITAVGQAPATTAMEFYKGRCAFKMVSATGVALLWSADFTLPYLKGGAVHKGDYQCWRVKLIAAFNPAGSGDLGLFLTVDGNRPFLGGTTPGFGLRPAANNQVTFNARGVTGSALSIADVMPAAIDVTEYNCYEFRLIGATDTTDATLRVLINNAVQAEYSWGDVGLLPTGVLNVYTGSSGGGTMWQPVGSTLVAGAYDEASLL